MSKMHLLRDAAVNSAVQQMAFLICMRCQRCIIINTSSDLVFPYSVYQPIGSYKQCIIVKDSTV